MAGAGNRSSWQVVGLLVVVAAMCVGCRKQPAAGDNSQGGAPSANVVARTAADQWPNPPEDACQAFGAALQQAVEEGNVASINVRIDWDVIIEKVVGDTRGMGNFVDQFVKGAKIGIEGANGLAGELSKTVGQGGNYKLLRIRTRDGRSSAVFRHLSQEVGVNYHEYLLALNPAGDVCGGCVHLPVGRVHFDDHSPHVPAVGGRSEPQLPRQVDGTGKRIRQALLQNQGDERGDSDRSVRRVRAHLSRPA